MAQPEPLASPDDVVVALGRDLTESEEARVDSVLRKASALFRREARQLFTPGFSDVRLKVNGGRVYLPQSPVTDVTSVVDDDGAAVAYTRRQQWLRVPLGSDSFVIVVYAHGDVEVPDLVRTTVAEVAMKVFQLAPEAVSGVSQYSETRGPFTESRTYAAWSVGGQTALSPDVVAIARSFRVTVPTVWVQPAPAACEADWWGPNILTGSV